MSTLLAWGGIVGDILTVLFGENVVAQCSKIVKSHPLIFGHLDKRMDLKGTCSILSSFQRHKTQNYKPDGSFCKIFKIGSSSNSFQAESKFSIETRLKTQILSPIRYIENIRGFLEYPKVLCL